MVLIRGELIRRARYKCKLLCELVSLIDKILQGRESFMKSAKESIITEEYENLLRVGFIDELKSTDSLSEAIRIKRCELGLAEEEYAKLQEKSQGLGEGYLSDDLARLREMKDALCALYKSKLLELDRLDKLSRPLLASVSVGIVLFFL